MMVGSNNTSHKYEIVSPNVTFGRKELEKVSNDIIFLRTIFWILFLEDKILNYDSAVVDR